MTAPPGEPDTLSLPGGWNDSTEALSDSAVPDLMCAARRTTEAKVVAVLLGAHPRAGQASVLRLLPEEVLQRIVQTCSRHRGWACKMSVKLGVAHTPY